MKKKIFSGNFIVRCGVYPFDVMFSVGEGDDELNNVLVKYGLDGEMELCRYSSDRSWGNCCMFDSGAIMVRLRGVPVDGFGYGVLAHEIYHAGMYLMDRIGIKIELGVSDEALAYVIQYLHEKFWEGVRGE